MRIVFKSPKALIGNLKAALRFACEDFARKNMHCVRLEILKDRARFIATNGHSMWLNETAIENSSDKEVEFSIRLKDVKTLVKIVDKKGLQEVVLDTEGLCFQQAGTSLPFEIIDDIFPPYSQILPEDLSKGTSSVAFTAPYIADVAAAFVDACEKDLKKTLGPGIRFHFGETDLHPSAVTSDDVPHAVCVVMPRREADAKHGRATVNRYRFVKKMAAA